MRQSGNVTETNSLTEKMTKKVRFNFFSFFYLFSITNLNSFISQRQTEYDLLCFPWIQIINN